MRMLALTPIALLLGAGLLLETVMAPGAAPSPVPRTATSAVLPAGGARPIVVTGRVTDASTGSPLSGVVVFVEGTGIGTLTDDSGAYALSVPDAYQGRTLRVQTQLIGYASATQQVRLDAGAAPVLDFALSTQAAGLDEIAVEAEAVPQGAADAAARSRELRAAPPALFSAQPSPGVTGPDRRYAPPTDREGYAHIQENTFLSARANPLSTFAIDVDRASYANVRRFLLGQGQLPPVDAVRIEELVNYFPYAYADPRGQDPFAVHTDVAPAPWAPEHRLLRVALRGRPLADENRPPSNLVFLIDVSGSMQSPDKLPLLKRAFGMLAGELRPIDRVAIVVYAGAAGLVLPPTTGNRKQTILEAIDRLQAGGSTAGGAGIRLAYDVARRSHIVGGNNRVILATDGDFNVGASSDAEMVRLIEEKREQGTFLTVLGFGTGNLQDAKMEQIADHGNGNFAYIDSDLEARKVLVAEMGGTLHTIAEDVKIQVEFNPAVVRGYRLIGYENRLLAAEDFDDDRKDAGELGAGHTVTALYEVVPVGARSRVEIREPGELRYGERERGDASEDAGVTAEGGRRSGPAGRELAFVKLRYKQPEGRTSRLLTHPVPDRTRRAGEDLRFAASVAVFGMLLRESEFAGTASWAMARDLARGALGDDPDGYRAEFLRMIDVAASLEADDAPLAGRE
ncbi:MAG TPA: von Willebrand factor type A domain-containing protein [Longimicrobiales bacterium]|nr:von Willebrand factor type A domain-containing protein [Longimicrobiales bacterium]